ncbi:unnamed protein product [Protopolystoma xenopodis]|uniref:Uncharacterized protein n=1 Tax=Protopolystoma xenopodis TaxID=117903 RepID=A0A3S5B015_9PLAT|nr:unnamed protein product [Protopolystoma xenopodis]
MALTFQRIHISKAIIETLERDEPPPVPPALPVASSIGMPISNISSSPPQSRQQRRPTAAPTTLKPAVTESDLISGEVTDSSTSELRKRRQYYQPPSPSLSPLRAISSLAPALSNFPASLTPALHSPGQEVDQTNLFRHRSRECIRERDDFDGYVEESRDHQNRWRRRQHRSRRSHSRSFESKGDLEENADNAEDGNVGSRRHKLLEAGLIGDEETQNENRSTPSKRRRLHHECRNSEERRERRRRWERREMESPAPQPSVDLLARNERQVATSRLVPAETVITRDREDEALSDPGTPTRDEQPFSLQPEHHGATGLDPKEEGTRKVELTLSEQSQDDRKLGGSTSLSSDCFFCNS